ncbi:xylulokinase [Goodfellowiella coeruleoviolacea]|uniref:Xylulokinase n=1 Tax=Goodfellowiella coeruleoviolacea TaxID=334858 RepID=A0AAE3GA67_9PSEU|nr:xylulokinase [Goodfellowiella coeruleoviolacea]
MYVGVDVGTSVTKAVAFAESGEQLDCEVVDTRLSHPSPGLVEQDTDEVVDSVGAVIRGLLDRVREPVELLALTGQGDGLWLVDDQGRPVRPAVSWMDGRAAGTIREWTDSGVADAVFQANGNTLFPGCAAALLAHLDAHEPAALDRATTAAYCKDVVFQRLTGVRATDASDASLPFGDPAGGYSEAVLKATGLTHRADLLAPVRTPLPVGELHAAGAAATGLPVGTPVTSGPFDLPACARGAGVVHPGDGMLIIGTTLACQVASSTVDTSGAPAGMNLATGTPGRFLRAMPAMVGTASVDWVLRLTKSTVDDLPRLLAAAPPGARGVSVLPYFAPSGERAPFVDPFARGQFSGLTLQHDAADVVRAVCEGIAYAARHCLEAAGLSGALAVSGGGARSDAWLRVFADVLRRPLHIAQGTQVGARGAVVAGLAALGRPVDEAGWTGSARVVEPGAAADHYERGYQRYLDQLAAARPLWGAA